MAALTRTFPVRTFKVDVHLNSVSGDGLIRARITDDSREMAVGATVLAVDSDDEAQGLATVRRLNRNAGLAYLEIHWHTLQDIPLPSAAYPIRIWVAPSSGEEAVVEKVRLVPESVKSGPVHHTLTMV